MRQIYAWGMLALAVAAWGACGYFAMIVQGDRTEYTSASARAEEESMREENAARLRSTIQGTEIERAALESLVGVTILDAVETIEAAAKQAGASDVKIGEASTQSTSTQKLSSVSVTVTASGSFVAVMRAVALLETLPLPSTIEQFDLSKSDSAWRLTARLRVTLAAEK
ncbi:MAG: hypothetical protein AAB734_03135 [Patescibacteria group bacterium]